MGARFTSNLLLAVLGGALATFSLVFAPGVTRWVALGTGCAAVVIALAGFAIRGRGPGQRSLDVIVVVLGAWTIVASCAFTGHTLRWLSFSEGAGLALLAVSGLISHQVLVARELRLAVAAWKARDTRPPTELRQPVPARPDVAA
jgi:hypothetical protein